MGFGGLAGSQADLDDVGAQRRGDAGEVEPVHALKDGVKVKVGHRRVGHGGMRTVIDADGTTLGSALLVEVDAHTVAAAGDLAGVDAIAAQRVDAGLADGMGGQLGHKRDVGAVVGQRDRHVGLAAAVGVLQRVGLHKAQVIVRLQADHDFTKSNDFHGELLLSCYFFKKAKQGGRAQRCTRWMAKPATSSAR